MPDAFLLVDVASAFQRVLSGRSTLEDLTFCRSLEPLRELVRSALIAGETESDGFDRLLTRYQGLPAMTSLARVGGNYFDSRGKCRSSEHARAFIDAALARLPGDLHPPDPQGRILAQGWRRRSSYSNPALRFRPEPQHTFPHPVPGWRLRLSRQPPTPISTRQGAGQSRVGGVGPTDQPTRRPLP